jgi:DNA topoisomerase I
MPARAVPDDPAPGLVFSSDAEPGFARRRRGRGFSYLDEAGRAITSSKVIERIKALAVPPAWRDVWICPDPDGHLQATGRDARGRKVYRYHPDYRAHRDQAKFDRLADFGAVLGAVRRQVQRDLDRRGLPREKVLAAVVALLEATMIRVGNEEYARANQSYGLTTLRGRHAKPDGQAVRFVFKGKSGKQHRVCLDDRRLARIVRRCQELPGQLLFQYVDEDGDARAVTSSDVNEYLRETSGMDVTAKDFRTWMGTLLAATTLAKTKRPKSDQLAQRRLTTVIEVVADKLGNTPAVARSGYVHPAVVDGWLDGSLPRRWARGPSRAAGGLLADERRLLRVLRAARAASARTTSTAAAA